jgi:RHS repeat-associated protein
MANPDLEILEENNYYPFGLKQKGYNNNVTSTNIAQNYKYNGKELNEEFGLNMYDYGARNFMPDIGRWVTIDPLSELYDSHSPYAYVLNNPILYVDPDGMKIDLSDIFRSMEGLQAGLKLLLDLSEQTGLSLSVNNSSEGALVEYLKDDNGDATVRESESGQKQGSETARNDLTGAIDDTRILKVSLQTHNLGSKSGGLVMALDPEQINSHIQNVSDNLNPKTLGYGMTFLHELQHTDLGGNLSDTKKEFAKGPTVERVNIIREELDKNPNSSNQKQYGIRKAYMSDEVSRTSINKNYEKIISKVRFSVLNEKGKTRGASTTTKVVKKKEK